jgi:hypothetical protein
MQQRQLNRLTRPARLPLQAGLPLPPWDKLGLPHLARQLSYTTAAFALTTNFVARVVLRVCRVSAHFVDQPAKDASKQQEQPSRELSRQRTTILIKFDASVMQRQAQLDAARRS